MHNSDIIEVLDDNAARDDHARPGLLVPGYYLALPRRHKKNSHQQDSCAAPTLVGPVNSEAAAQLLKVSSAYLGLDRADRGRRPEAGREGSENRRRYPPPRTEAIVQARFV